MGPRAFSGPEVQAVRNLVARELFAGVLTYHSYSQTYTVEQSSQLYPAGDTTDWTYGEYGIPSFTIELRPDTQAKGFISHIFDKPAET